MRQPSKPSPRLAWRVARRVRDALKIAQHKREQLHDIDHHAMSSLMARWHKISRQINHARRRQWHGALSTLTAALQFVLRNIQLDLSAAKRAMDLGDETPLASMRDLLADLDQLKDEFGPWRFDGQAGMLSVTTESITLEQIELGPFAIRLDVGRLTHVDQKRVYLVDALEPNPAEGSSHVTHPHVSDSQLCEGDASAAIRNALEQGRIADFFILVRSVLTTYNPGSPYVSLDRWHGGTSCYDCGDHVSDDDRSYCERCSEEFCSSCTTCCESCQNYFCGRCMVTCPCCDEVYCGSCISICALCHTSTCEGCLDDGVCTTCRERNQDESDDESTPGTITPGSCAAFESDGEGIRGGGDEDEENSDGDEHRLPAADEEEHPGADPAILAVCLGEAARLP